MAKVTVDRKVLAEALALLAGVLPRRCSIPAIQNVKLTANGTARLTATDLELSATVELARGGRGNGVAVVPGALLTNYVRASKAAQVVIEPPEKLTDEREGAASCTVLDGDTKVIGIYAADFPVCASESAVKPTLRVRAADFARAVGEVAPFVSSEVVRYALTGILLELRGGKGHMVSSDGKRLAHTLVEAKGADTRVIISTRAAALLAKVAEGNEWIGFSVHAREGSEMTDQFAAQVGPWRVAGRLIDGNFPDYEAVMPNDRDKFYSMERKELIDAINRVRVFTTDKTRAMKVTLSADGCELFTRTQDVGETRVRVPVIKANGHVCEIVLNPDYVLDYLKAEKHDSVDVAVKDKTSAIVMSANRRDERAMKYVQMPLTVTL